MAYDIFISYRRSNEQLRTNGTEVARSIKQQLELRGYRGRIFFDYSVEEMDDYFENVILSNLEKCKVLILVLSRGSMGRVVNDGDWVRREISCAKRCGLKIIPVDPDKQFDGFPDKLPDELTFLPSIQRTTIHMDESFEDDIDRLIERRIKAVVKPHDSDDEQQSGGARFHVETDMDCRILKFGKEIDVARPKKDTTIRLPKGRHKLTFVSTEYPDDCLSMTYTVKDAEIEDFIEIELLPIREKRLQAELEERGHLKAEEERREDANILGLLVHQIAEHKAHEETVRKAEATRKAEEERKAKEEVVSKDESESLTVKADEAFEIGNYSEAFRLYTKAAEMGGIDAQYKLSRCYYKGLGVAQDYSEAVKWYRKAIEQGYASTQFNLGKGKPQKISKEAKAILPKSLAFENNGKKFYMILSDDEQFYLGNLNAKEDDLSWWNNKWIQAGGVAAICAGAMVFGIVGIPIALVAGLKVLNDIFAGQNEKTISDIIVNSDFCSQLNKHIGYNFSVPFNSELKGVKEEMQKGCIVLRICDNPQLYTCKKQ